MLTNNELLEKCSRNEPITREDLGLDTSHDCPYEHSCDKCNGKFCKGMYYVHKNGLTIYNARLRGGK